jgi:hypothetical protein
MLGPLLLSACQRNTLRAHEFWARSVSAACGELASIRAYDNG